MFFPAIAFVQACLRLDFPAAEVPESETRIDQRVHAGGGSPLASGERAFLLLLGEKAGIRENVKPIFQWSASWLNSQRCASPHGWA